MPGPPLARRQSLALPVSQALLIVGAALRVIEYLANRPLSIDESFLALNLIEKSPAELLHGLDFKQAAPLGFLEVEKLAVDVFGRGEYAMRLLPLLASLASLVLFYKAGKLLPVAALPFACGAFALLDPTIYYAATAKQYELDLAATVALFALAASMLPRPITSKGFLSLAVAGAVVVWFSHASAFVLAAVGITLAAAAIARRSWAELGRLGAVSLIWLISLGAELQLSRSNISRIQQSFDSSQVLGTGKGSATWFEAATASSRYLVGLEDTATGAPILDRCQAVSTRD